MTFYMLPILQQIKAIKSRIVRIVFSLFSFLYVSVPTISEDGSDDEGVYEIPKDDINNNE